MLFRKAEREQDSTIVERTQLTGVEGFGCCDHLHREKFRFAIVGPRQPEQEERRGQKR